MVANVINNSQNQVFNSGLETSIPPLPVTEQTAQIEAVQKLGANTQQAAPKAKAWHERAIAKIDEWEGVIDQKIPHITHFLPQHVNYKIDQIGDKIEKTFAKLDKFNAWIDSNGNEKNNWFEKLAIFLCKLPMRIARNILVLLYQVVKAAVYVACHPVKSLTQLAKLLVKLANELTKPETWTKIGLGIFGASVGQALAMGNPIAPISAIIGLAMIFCGVSIGAIKAAVQAEKGKKLDAALENLKQQGLQMPETFATSFVMGLIFGAIQKASYDAKAAAHKAKMTEYNKKLTEYEAKMTEYQAKKAAFEAQKLQGGVSDAEWKNYLEYEGNINNYRYIGVTKEEGLKLAEQYAKVHGLPKPSGVCINPENGYVRFDWTGDAYRQFIADAKVREFFLSQRPLWTSWPRGPIGLNGVSSYQVDTWGVELGTYPGGSELQDYAGRVAYKNTDLFLHMKGPVKVFNEIVPVNTLKPVETLAPLKEISVLNLAATAHEATRGG